MRSAPHIPDLPRDPGPCAFVGVRARSREALCWVVDEAGDRPCVISDLSLGAWRSHHVAQEFAAQLGIVIPRLLPSAPLLSERSSGPPDQAEMIGRLVDAESQGDFSTLAALDLAGRIAATAGQGACVTFVVIAPRFGMNWEPENLLFIRFLSNFLADEATNGKGLLRPSGTRSKHSVVKIVSTDQADPVLPEDWRVTWVEAAGGGEAAPGGTLCDLVPGVISAEVFELLRRADPSMTEERLVLLPGGFRVVAPECRRSPATADSQELERLALAARSVDWVSCFARHFRGFQETQPWASCARAWQRFAEGSRGTALRELDRLAITAREPRLHAALRCMADGVRIALRRFDELAAAPDPVRGLPPKVQRFLLQAKGWGLLMTGRAEAANRYFSQACAALDQQDRRSLDGLYLLNISALARLRMGDVDGAISLEHEIEASHGALPTPDWSLKYVNAINLARLYRTRTDWETSRRYYERAFATHAGARSSSDLVYMNVCFARLAKERGRFAEALGAWVRAALHWVSSHAPEAIGPRVLTLILGAPPGNGIQTEAVSAALLAHIRSAAAVAGNTRTAPLLAGSTLASPSMSSVPFARVEDQLGDASGADPVAIVLGDGWSVVASRRQVRGASTGAQHSLLRATLFDLIRGRCPRDALPETRSILVDDDFGFDIPCTQNTQVSCAVRLRAPALLIASCWHFLRPSVYRELEQNLRVRRSSAVAELTREPGSIRVSFKRYLAPLRLSGTAIPILDALGDGTTVRELHEAAVVASGYDRLMASLRGLERARVIRLELDAIGGILGPDIGEGSP